MLPVHPNRTRTFVYRIRTDLADPARPLYATHDMALCPPCRDRQPCPVSASEAPRKEPFLEQHAWLYALPHVEEGPRPLSSAHTPAVRKIIAAGCKQRPFWAVSAMVAAWIGSNERHGHEYATNGDFASLGEQLSAVSMHHAGRLHRARSL